MLRVSGWACGLPVFLILLWGCYNIVCCFCVLGFGLVGWWVLSLVGIWFVNCGFSVCVHLVGGCCGWVWVWVGGWVSFLSLGFG